MLPGGFSYGDYLRGGAMAAHSPIMRSVAEKVRDGVAALEIGTWSTSAPPILVGVSPADGTARFRVWRDAGSGLELTGDVEVAGATLAVIVGIGDLDGDGNNDVIIKQATIDGALLVDAGDVTADDVTLATGVTLNFNNESADFSSAGGISDQTQRNAGISIVLAPTLAGANFNLGVDAGGDVAISPVTGEADQAYFLVEAALDNADGLTQGMTGRVRLGHASEPVATTAWRAALRLLQRLEMG